MKMLFKLWLMPLLGMFFAAGDSGLADAGAVEAPPAGETGGELEYGGDTSEGDAGDETDAVVEKPVQAAPTEEPEVQEFKGHVSARLRGLVKQSPKLAEAFKENPKLQEQIEATFRREAALREVFPTVAEARQMRERFPNGLADVQQLESDVKEVEELDKDFYGRGQDGAYPGHAKIVDNMWRDDPQAASALFRSIPKEWHRRDPEGYNDVMGKIVGATLANSREIADLDDALQSGDQKRIEASVKKFFSWANGFLSEKPRPTAEQEAIARDRAKLDKDTQDRAKQDGQRFHTSFISESKKLQTNIIKAHPAVKRLLENKAVTDAKKAEMIEQVRADIESLLGKSRSFMEKLRPAHASRNLQETLNLQKAAWSEQWRLNSAVRRVFNKEVPQMVSTNRDAVKRRAGTPPPRTAGDKSKTTPTGPRQIGGRWFRDGGNGAPFTTAEVLAGKHLA